MLRDGGDLAHSGSRGLYGAVAIAPKGRPSTTRTSWSTVVRAPDGDAWRDVVLFMHDADDAIGTHRMPYTSAVRGAVGAELRPRRDRARHRRLRRRPAPSCTCWRRGASRCRRSPSRVTAGPSSQRWTAAPSSARSPSAAWSRSPSSPEGGAGGETALPGRYELGDHREPYREAGLTGTLIVHDTTTAVDGLERLTKESTGTPAANPDSPGTSPPPTSATITPANGGSDGRRQLLAGGSRRAGGCHRRRRSDRRCARLAEPSTKPTLTRPDANGGADSEPAACGAEARARR